MTRSQRSLLAPSAGMITIGNTSATMIPLIITVAILLKTDRLPLSVVFLVDRGTIRVWLIL